jgi:glucose-1-phosphate thymidylyltransferase
VAKAEKVVILARGVGSRMRKADGDAQMSEEQAKMADTGVKAMIPIGRPFLDYVLSACADAGVTRACLVIGPEHDVVRDYYTREIKLGRVKVSFAVQEKPLGTANAVAAAEEFAGGEPFLMLNSDNYYPVVAIKALRDLDSCGAAGFERDAMLRGSNIPGDRIEKFAIVDVNEGGMLKRVIEKPDREAMASVRPPICVSMNCWRFDGSIFEACRAIQPSVRGEYEVTDAVQYCVDRLGVPFKVVRVAAPVLDMSSRGDIAAVGERLKGTEVTL